ncbi:6-pyruvoyl-tetrahydropterin synthase-related protein [Fructilactobacillus vespulae]|uniref:6-pyruvoyl-tetrahydropterin synthase-related protein n=1 Tax=Fructilactobacillus vespulae TaxID=1249630 RepID=UPI0039B4EE40
MNYLNKILKSKFSIILSFLLLSIVQVKPFITKNLMLKNWGNFFDIDFHVCRLISMNDIFTHPINYTVFSQTGNGTNLFYPWIFLYPANLVAKLFNSYVIGYISLFVLITFSTFLVYFYCGKYFFKSSKAASLFSVVYVFSNVRYQYGYFLNDFGHFTAMIFLPLVFLYWHKIVFKKENSWIGLAVSMSLLAYSHVLSTLLAGFLLIILSLFFFKNSFNKFVVINFFKATISFLFITAFFWVTLLQQLIMVRTTKPITFLLQSTAYAPKEMLKSALSDNLNATATGSIGIIGLFTIIIGTLMLIKSTYRFKVIYFLSIGTLFITTNKVPWKIFQHTPISVIQFPFRFIEFTSLFLALFFVMIIQRLIKLNLKKTFLISAIVVSLGFTTSTILVNSKLKIETKYYSNSNDFRNISRNYATKDYVPLKSSAGMITTQGGIVREHDIKKNIIDKKYLINGSDSPIKAYYGDTNVMINLEDINHNYVLDTPIYYYEGTFAKIDGKITNVKQSDRGTVQLEIPKHSKKLEITNEYTNLAKFSAILSLTTLLFILFNLYFRKLKK